jgi:hypothetical protein
MGIGFHDYGGTKSHDLCLQARDLGRLVGIIQPKAEVLRTTEASVEAQSPKAQEPGALMSKVRRRWISHLKQRDQIYPSCSGISTGWRMS